LLPALPLDLDNCVISLTLPNTLAYYYTEKSTAIKGFMIQALALGINGNDNLWHLLLKYKRGVGNCDNYYFTIEFKNQMWVQIVWIFESDWIPNCNLSNKSNLNTDKWKDFQIRLNVN